MKIAIIGTRGIPNKYGGFEQFAEKISIGLVRIGYQVTVYNPHFHEYLSKNYNNVYIRRIFSPEKIIGSSANYLYDFLSLKDALKNNFDIIYECGYQSSSFSYLLLPINKSIIITNMDGLEWKRSKWNRIVKFLTKLSEKIAVKKSHYLVADNEGIREYYKKKFHKDSFMIPYGAEIFNSSDEKILEKINLEKYNYYLNIARLEPENNIETIIEGVIKSNSQMPLIIVGNTNTKYGSYLVKKYSSNSKVKFLGGIYDPEIINNLRHFSKIYFHGHSVGGTNPALLEAMACGAYVVAHDNEFNRNVLPVNSDFFKTSDDIKNLIDSINADKSQIFTQRKNNIIQIKSKYSWSNIIDQYEKLFLSLINQKK